MTRRNILIVEDDIFIAADIEAVVLATLDAETFVSRSVGRARNLLDNSLDLALLDVDVTNGKTFELALQLKRRCVPFIFISGSRRDHIPDELQDEPFIAKPCDERELVKALLAMLPN